MNDTYHIQLMQEQKEFHLHVAPTITLEQLHKAILILFRWEDDGFFKFSFLDQEVIEGQADQPIGHLLRDHTSLQYTNTQVGKCEWIDIKAVKDTDSLSHSIQLSSSPCTIVQENRLQAQLDALSIDEELEQATAEILENIRTDLEKRKTIAPYLIISESDVRPFLFYLDVLDNGMELMAFADEKVFIRSILNSMNEDPDLLFTDSYTFDFLYDDVEHSELPLYHQHNLCFKNEPGQLPRALNHTEKRFAVALLDDFYQILKRTPSLPSLGEKQVLRVRKNVITVEDFHISNRDNYYERQENTIPQVPHTNEQIHLMLQAVPEGHDIKVRLTAINDHFTKTATVHMNPIALLQEEVDMFLMQLFKERGIAEAFILHSRNLQQMIMPICEKLGIRCMCYSQPIGADLFLADMLSQAFPMIDEERYPYQSIGICSQNKILN